MTRTAAALQADYRTAALNAAGWYVQFIDGMPFAERSYRLAEGVRERLADELIDTLGLQAALAILQEVGPEAQAVIDAYRADA